MRAVVLAGTTFGVGACVGSFLNVVAYRLPRECMSVVRPRSRCPRCSRPIAAVDNVPILAWFWLRGRCRGCSLKISFRYPLVELVTALLFVLVAWWVVPAEGFLDPVSHGSSWLTFGVFAFITSCLVALSLIDLDYRILPDEITKPGMVVGPVLAFLAPGMQHGRYAIRVGSGWWEPRLSSLASGALGVVVAGGILWLVGWLGSKAFKKDAMGFGDVKMIAGMGGCLGLWALLSLVVASVFGALVGIVYRVVAQGRYIPFGPFLALGMFAVMLFGPWILDGYLGLLAP